MDPNEKTTRLVKLVQSQQTLLIVMERGESFTVRIVNTAQVETLYPPD